MAPRKPERELGILTRGELELMQVIWARGRSTARDVLGALEATEPGRDRAYTTVATLLQILADKGFLQRHAEDRVIEYSAKLKRDVYERRALRDLTASLFAGDVGALVSRLVESEGLTPEDVERLRDELTARGRG